MATYPTKYWRTLADGRVECTLCPRLCHLRDGQRGLCFVRACENGKVVLTSYGRSGGFCIDPIEKKPLNHFLPGTPVLSFGTAGCNLACKFCQNHDVSKSREMDSMLAEASPESIARTALRAGAKSVAYTYNDPVIFHEYAVDTAKACHHHGIKNVAVTAGYINPEPRLEFFRHMDAANVDLKAFSDDFYWKLTGSHLAPVLETLEYLVHKTTIWVEITTLLIPGQNDSEGEIQALAEWVGSRLTPHIPLHFTAFHPDYRMMDIPRTPAQTLLRARQIARQCGLKHVYVGNIHHQDAQSSYCAGCGALVIGRDWHQLSQWRLSSDGHCLNCGDIFPGVIQGAPGTWGSRRMPVDPVSA
jgi:pyruvate formate lyase activating enzyme